MLDAGMAASAISAEGTMPASAMRTAASAGWSFVNSVDAFADFLTDYKASTEFTNDHPAEAAVLIADAGIVPSAEIAEAAIPASNITYIDGAELKSTFSGYLQVLFDADPASVGGSMPGDDFYFSR